MRQQLITVILAVAFTSTCFAGAQATGRIEGHVYDMQGTPLIGATVMVVGTSFGAMTGTDGSYSISNLTAGSYDVIARMVGMGDAQITGIVVTPGGTTTCDFGSTLPHQVINTGSATEPERAHLDEEPFSGRLQGVIGDSTVIDLPLEHTNVSISVAGNLQRAVVQQVYGNPYAEPIEAVYTFPLPDNGAVDRMSMYIGDRQIVGRIYESDAARAIYEEAVQEGRTASLFEQQRPNIFTQSIGNILPGDSITVEISYVATVPYDDGRYVLTFPMVVGPRFIPGQPSGRTGTGYSPDTDAVPDASLITPRILPEGARSGYDINLSVNIDAGFRMGQVRSLNHNIDEHRVSPEVMDVSLVNEGEIPNRDFVLTYTSTSDAIQPAFLTTNGELGGHFLLILQPDLDVDPEEVVPKELFFVVDCSGSMNGRPIEAAKEAVRQFVRGMNPFDSFQIIRFSESASGMSDHPLENTGENIERGVEYINGLSGGGGTMMIEGIRAATGYPADPDRMRFVIFLTDGYIGNESQILSELRDDLGDNIRLFSVGIGSSSNRYLIESLAEEGRGMAFYIGVNEDPIVAVNSIYERINNPYLVNVEIDWGPLEVFDVIPSYIPDLYTGQPVVVTGRYSQPGSGVVTLSGFSGRDRWIERLRVLLPERETAKDVIATLWARRRIHEYTRESYTNRGNPSYSQELIDSITDTALRYGIVSDYTSFVAVSEEVRNIDGVPTTVEVPVNMPEGVSYETHQGVYATVPGGLRPVSVGATIVTITDQRAMMTLPPTGASPVSPLIRSNLRVESLLVPPGYDSLQVASAFASLMTQVETEYSDLIDQLDDVTPVPRGKISVFVGYFESGSVEFIRISENATGSDELAEILKAVFRGARIPSVRAGRGTVEIVISFEG